LSLFSQARISAVSQVCFINQLVATPHLAQIIHQKGKLVFANLAAARMFGLPDLDSFVELTSSTNLFGTQAGFEVQTRIRRLKFRQLDGSPKQAQINEKAIIWNGHPSSYLTLTLVKDETPIDDADMVTSRPSNSGLEETYFLDSMDSAMDWSRTDSGFLGAVFTPFDLAGVCLRLCDDLSDWVKDNGVMLSMEISPKALNIFNGDSGKLVRAASCIVQHAVKRVRGGRVKINLVVDQAGEHITFEVSDSGPSYTSWDAVKLLEPPQIGNQNTTGGEPDADLDLPLAQCIAQSLGGKVALKVNHPSGGLVRLRLPFPIALGEERIKIWAKGEHIPLRILVAEDNFTSQQIIKVILQALGYTPTIVSDGAQCVEAMQFSTYDAIFMDLHMPLLDGYETTRLIRAYEEMRAQGHYTPVPILALTADRRVKSQQLAMAAGVNGFLTKPIHIPQILSALAPIIADIRHAKMIEKLVESTSLGV
jgi:CheY-like chemotaxis protein